MASTALAKTSGGNKGRGVAKFDMGRFDPAKMAARADAFSRAVGGGDVGGVSKFPGQKYSYSMGTWYKGAGKKKTPIAAGTEFAIVALRAAATWVKWDNGKPKYLPDVYHLADGDELPARETLGDMDQSEWDTDDKGQPQDPWKPVMVLPVRDVDGDTINHIELQTKSGTIAAFGLFKEIIESLPSHMGEVPVVKLGSKKAEMKKNVEVTKRGKKVEEEKVYKWDTPVFEVVDWVEMKACDDPDGSAQVEASDDVGEVESKSRTVETKKVPPSAPAPKAAKRKVKAVADDDDNDV